MANKKKTIGEWIDSVFGTSYKTISEKLSVEEHDRFIQEATELQAQVLAQEGEEEESTDEDSEENEETETTATKASNTTIGENAADQSIEQRLAAVEAALKKEQSTNKSLQAKLTQTETQLKASQDTNKKLRATVNPLGDQDAANARQEEKHLTKADIEARAAWKANQETEA